jgi:DNA polymerase-4
VEPSRPLQQVSIEQTLETDLAVSALSPVVRDSAARAWVAASRTGQQARTVVLKLKTSDFRSLTRSQTPVTPPASADDVLHVALALLSRVDLPMATRYRLAGVGLSNFKSSPERDPQLRLF